MKFKCFIVADAGLIPLLIDDASPLRKDMQQLDAMTGHFRDVHDWEWGKDIPSRKGLESLNAIISAGGGTPMGSGYFRVSNEITQNVFFDKTKVAGVFAALQAPMFGGLWLEIANYAGVVKVAAANVDDEVPAYMPSRMQEAEIIDDVVQDPVPHTWRTYGRQSNGTDPVSDGSFFYIQPSYRCGFALVGSVVAQLLGSGFDYLTSDEFLAVQNSLVVVESAQQTITSDSPIDSDSDPVMIVEQAIEAIDEDESDDNQVPTQKEE